MIDNPKERAGALKAPLALLPDRFLRGVARVMAAWAAKYGRWNWRASGGSAETYANATLRHVTSWFEGEENDPDDGESHLDHAIASLTILRDLQLGGNLKDDRPAAKPFDPIQIHDYKVGQPYKPCGHGGYGPGEELPCGCTVPVGSIPGALSAMICAMHLPKASQPVAYKPPSQAEFKVGDRVRIVKSDYYAMLGRSVDAIGTVAKTNIANTDCIQVTTIDEGDWNFYAHELELA